MQSNEYLNQRIADIEARQRRKYLKTIETWLKTGVDFGIAADFDDNISETGSSGGLDPRDSRLHPDVHDAFSNIIRAGKDIVIISSRGAQDVKQIINIPGVAVVGTLGWETLDVRGSSHLNACFDPYRFQITDILGEVKRRFLKEQLHMFVNVQNAPNIELPTPGGGKIIFQPKGYNEKFPQGINHTYSMNLALFNEGEAYKVALEEYYNTAFAKQTRQMSEQEKIKLRAMCSFMIRTGVTSVGVPTFDVEIRPAQQSAKREAIIQLMMDSNGMERSGTSKRQSHFIGMPLHKYWIYSGDHRLQDGVVWDAISHIKFKSRGHFGGLSIWSRLPHEPFQYIPSVDVTVNGVKGNASLMGDTARLIIHKT